MHTLADALFMQRHRTVLLEWLQVEKLLQSATLPTKFSLQPVAFDTLGPNDKTTCVKFS